ncbi:polysaccharide deacetylase family protein [Salegentibacter flavus]|uniref:Peptidoglycan/xylan/chitin deacetylase, PgdA/CDA1 family n=1 Tax=Salegentibacter flavus TaxID=287099 RepID=A0A1I5APJ3_9FLAO|nr:polysaccharide deacetylase family protein [Salegentibacter flavus]SFN64358.1 Peptidoglycan/xylan/chitin deacetylase, PgdA/CDA1 family [Salegentibacter flavus]
MSEDFTLPLFFGGIIQHFQAGSSHFNMNRFLVKYPSILRWFYPKRPSRIKAPKSIYLTFDDGPIPGITPWVLEQLRKYNAKATFFCIGENIEKHPEVFQQVVSEGHQIGNHSFHHLNGWKTSTSEYIKDVLITEELLNKEYPENPQPKLFRPPFGKIKNSQARKLTEQGFKIVMWDVISWDFDSDIKKETCHKNVIKNAKEGSIIVFHDSEKALKNLKYALPKVLKYFSDKGYEFKSL